jgi:hypothetical protein
MGRVGEWLFPPLNEMNGKPTGIAEVLHEMMFLDDVA